MRQALVIALCLCACDDLKRPGDACPEEGAACSREGSVCLGGICSGGPCSDSGLCPDGYVCTPGDDFLGLQSPGNCELACATDDECPGTWFCDAGACRFPPPLEIVIAGPNNAAAGEATQYRADVVRFAFEVREIEWFVDSEFLGPVQDVQIDGANITVVFPLDGQYFPTARVRDGLDRLGEAQLTVAVCAPAGASCAGDCCDDAQSCTGDPLQCG